MPPLRAGFPLPITEHASMMPGPKPRVPAEIRQHPVMYRVHRIA
ncbi:MAG TPA: hypothetical protein VKM55_25095 [Candidatus Lokiarchaeia archaeon]|nr:hypothetical protein [Candidatus Lokiarchaeia archaeon]